MSSSDRAYRRRFVIAIGLAAAMLAGGCNVRPLYGTAEIGGTSMTTALADVDVAPVDGRVGQKLRNDLLFLMNGGDPGSGAYIVTLTVKQKYANIITRSISGLPGGRNIRLTINYTMRQSSKPEVLSAGTVTRIASFDYFNQRFANDRATIDAENRAAREAAAEIHLRLASYFATGKTYDETAPVESEENILPNTKGTIFDDQEDSYGVLD